MARQKEIAACLLRFQCEPYPFLQSATPRELVTNPLLIGVVALDIH
jgi:hypothetical protein